MGLLLAGPVEQLATQEGLAYSQLAVRVRETAIRCERCGERTRRARRLVRLAIRVELLFFLMVVGVVVGFTWIYSVQR